MRILQALPPCPAGLDVALINKYYDLSRLGDVLAKERYGCGSAACRYTLPRQDAPFFTKLRGEFITSQLADVGIGAYRVLREFAAAHRADRGVRRYWIDLPK